MSEKCPECGGPVPDGGSCRDHFHALLLLEAEIPGVGNSLLHFYAVATYGLQHSDTMNYTTEALVGLRAAVADVLDGKLTLRELRGLTGHGPVRVTRRAGDPKVIWYRGHWPVTIADVCTTDTFGDYDTYDQYADHVVRWARSVRETLDAQTSTRSINHTSPA